MPAEFADALDGFLVDDGVVGVLDTVGGPEPQLLALRLGQRAEQAEADCFGADLGGGIDNAMVVGEVVVTQFGVDDAAARRRNRRNASGPATWSAP